MPITIDTVTFDVNITIVNREAISLDKFAGRTEDGVLQRELIGWYYNYRLQCGMSAHNSTDYANLFLKLTEPVEFHTIVMPGAPEGYEAFECYFAEVKDELYRHNKGGVDYFRSLSFSVITRNPSRIP